MGGKRKLTRSSPASSYKAMPPPYGVRSAYYSEDGQPLIRSPRRLAATSVRAQRTVSGLNRAFSRFYTITEEDITANRHDTHYDLHRGRIHREQTARLRQFYGEFWVKSTSVLDVGCGTVKLLRKMVRTPAIAAELEAGKRQMRMLGVDFNEDALRAAALKRDILFEHYKGLRGNLQMELLLLDLMDLDRLDLSKTCIGEDKVDVVLATDIFRSMRAKERPELLSVIKGKLKTTGCLISFEFTNPPLVPGKHLPCNLAMRLAKFYFSEPMLLKDSEKSKGLYDLASRAGFGEVLGTKVPEHDAENDPFPPMVSVVFQPGRSPKLR